MCSSGCRHGNNKLQHFFIEIFSSLQLSLEIRALLGIHYFFLISQDLFKLKHFTIIIFLEKVTTFITAALWFLKICSGDVEVCTPFVTQLLHAVMAGCLLNKMYKISEHAFTYRRRGHKLSPLYTPIENLYPFCGPFLV